MSLFEYPKQTRLDRFLPKNKIFQYAKPSTKVKELFVKEVEKIKVAYSLSRKSINLSPTESVPEIQIVEIRLKTQDYSEKILCTIDQAIRFPVIFELAYDQQVSMSAAYKRPSEADSNKWVVDAYFATPWIAEDIQRQPLPTALDMGRLYEQMLRPLMPYPAREGESLRAQAERMAQIQNKQNELKKIATKLKQEKQFNRKVEINAQLRALKNEITDLTKTKA